MIEHRRSESGVTFKGLWDSSFALGRKAAWRTKPSWFIVATQDKAIAPKLLHKQAKRIGAEIVEVEASHVPFITKPNDVASVIEKAAIDSVKATR